MFIPSFILGIVIGVLLCLVGSYFTEEAVGGQDYFDKHDHE